MTIAKFVQSDVTTQDASTYKASIDANFKVLSKLGNNFAPYANDTPNMSIKVSAGEMLVNTSIISKAIQSTSTITAPASGNTRIDRVVINKTTGNVSIITGTPSTGTPVKPSLTSNDFPVANILLSSSSTTITNSMITDERVTFTNASSGSSISLPIAISDVTNLQTSLDSKLVSNNAITAGTNTKITYDVNGLVTSGTSATTADISDSSNKRYVSDSQLSSIGNTVFNDTEFTIKNNIDATKEFVFDASGNSTAKKTIIASNATTNNVITLPNSTCTLQPLLTEGTNITIVGNVISAATASSGDTLTSEGVLINSATSKTTPVDADMLGLMDSASSNILKKLSWANLKATLKTYFDTLYQTTLAAASTSTNGYLTSTDWDTFNGKISSLAASINQTLTGFTSGAGTVTSSDTILTAIQKIVGNLSNYALLTTNTFTGAQVFSDQSISRANFIDCALVTNSIGTIGSTGTLTVNYTSGSVQSFTCGGAYTITLDISNWPPTGNKGFLEIQAINMGLGTLAFTSSINWKMKGDTYTTTFATYLTDRGGETTLKTSGLDSFLFWSQDAGTTIYGVLL